MRNMVDSLLWVLQDLYHQPYQGFPPGFLVGMGGGVIATTIRDYHVEPFPHHLLRAKEF